ncbi:hypothetical protein H310_07254 [Aphanomyces invadans]|uniref:NACHT domain-containing protein n=1 Tax=Aphanomyces invadans TaxID=157072 RepID=A0A024U2N4_9STRA|nr:hypothetical protein H310_07254 [Aphanomyces invadans]ETW00696.1 hypothetical protein H310_07254 [Aphanomyces invadans]|eukprot:XP_008870831.1 hypothetical protein H310_07254 [Aphanomyces invadans]
MVSASVNSDAITLPKELQSGEDTQRVESATLTRESGGHEAFARSRMEGFVYVETPPYMHVLDGHCRFELENGSSPLMVVLGHPASGKSALLVNWVHQRLRKPQPSPEVIFQHYCGCSYESVKLSVFLFRLMDHLKTAFSLRDFELPHEHEEEKLKFSLARCLDAANRTTTQNGKRKNIIIVLDGVDNLRTEDGSESLSWLPNTLPPGVRLLLSATRPPKTTQLASSRWIERKDFTYDADDDLLYDATLPPDSSDTHCVKELRRRNAGFLVVEPLDERMCAKIIHEHCARNTPMDDDTVQDILDCKGSSCPLYLRLVLTMFDQGHHHHLSDHFQSVIVHASDFPSLYELVLQQWKAILLTDLVEAVDHLTRKPAPAASDSSPQLDRPDSRKRNSRRESEHMTQMASQLSPEDDEMNRINVQMERRALLARHALSLFTVSRFGLSEKDFHHLLEDAAPRPIRTLLLQLLMPHLMAIHRKDSDSVLYDISHNQLRLLVRYGFLHDDGLRHGYHKAIASYCEKMPTCQRRIDELPVQLECCGMWSQLQSCLVEMKMFQLWWHERNRQDFLAYWKTLRSYFSTHDPVDDYIRSLDEYIEVEGPSTEQLLSLFLTITEFLRSWQRSDVKVKPDIHMHRPDPPQLKEFINSQGTFSLSHLTDVESKQIQGIVDYLCPHPDDGYFVRRWLWTQFPLIAVSFENLFLKKFTSEALAAWSGVGELDGGGSVSSSSSPPDKKDKSCSTTPAATSSSPHAATSTTSGSSYKFNHSILPKSVGAVVGDRKRVIARHSPKKNSQHVLELLNPEVSGAFEFGDAAGDISLSIPALRDQLRDLRARYDKLKFISKERQDALVTLESKVNDAKANTSHQNQNSRLRDELLEQIRITMLDSTHGRQKSDYYKSILRQCETNPARDPNIIESSEMNVRKMKQDITDLQQKAQVIGYERRLAAIEIPKLTTAIEEKLQIHQVALSRLRWRQLQHLRQMEWETKFRIRSKEMKKQAEGDLSSAQEEAMVVRLKEKVEHKQEANSMRVKNLQDLKVYKGSQFMDDGLLGVLRHVGINEVDQVLLRWHDQFEHADQLDMEQKAGEERVAACRQELEALRHELQNLKLGQTTVKPGKAPPPSTGNGKPSTSGSASDTTAMNDGGSKHHNIKQVELQLADATAILHQKKQRAIRLKALSENLHLGLLHLAVMLGVKASQGMDSIMLADAAEHSVRSLIGEEGGSGTSTNLGSLRKKNSMRKGITQTQAPVQRSQEEIQRYNLRVRTAVSPTKRFAGVECTAADDTDAFPESDDSDASGNDEEAVRDRADIKASSVLEVQNQTGGKRPARRRGKKKPTGSPSGQASAAGAVAATE